MSSPTPAADFAAIIAGKIIERLSEGSVRLIERVLRAAVADARRRALEEAADFVRAGPVGSGAHTPAHIAIEAGLRVLARQVKP